MKKTLTLFCVLVLSLTLSACHGGFGDGSSAAGNAQSDAAASAPAQGSVPAATPSRPAGPSDVTEKTPAPEDPAAKPPAQAGPAEQQTGSGPTPGASVTEEEESMETIRLFVEEKELTVQWEENAAVDALQELVKEHPLTIQMSMYGGFEQVGALGAALPHEDVQMTTSAGDIVLYSGDQIVLFYGANTWAYTRLGRVSDLSADDMAELLGHGDVEITLSNGKGE